MAATADKEAPPKPAKRQATTSARAAAAASGRAAGAAGAVGSAATGLSSAQGGAAGASKALALTDAALSRVPFAELREMCRARGLSDAGMRNDLKRRLLNAKGGVAKAAKGSVAKGGGAKRK